MIWSEPCAIADGLGWRMVSLSALPFPKGGSLGGMLWLELCAIPAELGSRMVSLSALPFPKGGSLGGMLWFEVCAIAPMENTDVNAAARSNFFTIFSEIFRLHKVEPMHDRRHRSYHYSTRKSRLICCILFQHRRLRAQQRSGGQPQRGSMIGWVAVDIAGALGHNSQ
jgi:hypothetical protein